MKCSFVKKCGACFALMIFTYSCSYSQITIQEVRPATTEEAAKIQPAVLDSGPMEYLPGDSLIIPPQFIAAKNNITNYINNHIKYPSLALDYHISGRIFVQFIIGENGKARNIRILNQSASKGGCQEEVIRIIKSMPKWKPGILKSTGKPISVQYNMPVDFKLDQDVPPLKTDCFDYFAKYGILLYQLEENKNAENFLRRAARMTDDSRDTFYNSIASLPPANYDPAICKALNYLNEQGEQKAKAVALKFCGAK